ncbi:trehalase family glycosidase [Acidicapsa dinghuensis]|uniref:Trehalase family glycosidase n=1 Tax=Acidicapsa dinghuensis TaxID=2218256 RepID=A0ABW1E9S6_9BACT|nr:alpha,alpha-trehalase [Acidicapsa dinghuensis]
MTQGPLRVLLRVAASCTLTLLPLGSIAQQPSASTTTAATPDPATTLDYIHKTWDVLTRSMTDCHSLVDVKVTTHPVLYLPAGMTAPAEIKALTEKCGVRIASLPRAIEKIGDLMPEDAGAPGLLYLPKPYVVPGGRFNEMYGWDSYFIVLGLIADHHEALARDMVENFFFEIDHYGGVLNANRTYYLTRSQPPFLTSMIRSVYEDPASFANRAEADAWLAHAYAMASKDYQTWMRPEHHAGTTGLARYYDYGEGPVPEMEDDSTYYADVIRWLVAHPKENPGFLLKGSDSPDEAEAARLKKTSCDVTKSKVCLRAYADGYRLTRDFYKGDRAMRESGFDPSFRFEAFSGATHHYAPVCLNSLLFRYERDMAHFAHLLGKANDAHQWEMRAKRRDIDMHRFLWQPKAGAFGDFDFTRGRASSYVYISSLYPLWAGVATREEAGKMESTLGLIERKGGLMMSATNTGLQWDDPYGWAPTNWIAVSGLDTYQFHDDAKRISTEFTATVDRGLATDGTIREKYNMEGAGEKVQVAIGYKSNEVGFGWTNSVYLKMKELIGGN